MPTRPITGPLTRSPSGGVTGVGGGWSPASLFFGATAGAVYDHAATASLKQLSTGATDAALGQPVGYRRDISPLGNNGLQATAGARPALSKRCNLLTYSEDFSNAVWSKANVSLLSGQADPWGGTSATRILDDAVSGFHNVFQNAAAVPNGVRLSFSCYVKAAGLTTLQLGLSDLVTGGPTVQFNIATGNLSYSQSAVWTNTVAFSKHVGGGWWRLWVESTKTQGTQAQLLIRLNAGSYAGAGNGIYVAGTQVSVGSVAPYQAITSAASYDTAQGRQFVDFDVVDDAIVTTFGASLGADCTIIRAVPGIGAQILTGQTVGTSFTDSTDSAALILVNRALSASETASATTWANARSAYAPVQTNSVAAWGDSLTAGSGGTIAYPARLGTDSLRGYYNGGVGGETSTQIATRALADTMARNHWVNLFWMGSNNPTAPATVKADIASVVANLASGNSRYLVFSVMNNAAYTNATPEYATIMTLNADLLALYGDRFLDVRAYLMTKGDGSANDNADIAAGLIPRSLRVDAIHLTDAGYQHVADCVKARLDSFGW